MLTPPRGLAEFKTSNSAMSKSDRSTLAAAGATLFAPSTSTSSRRSFLPSSAIALPGPWRWAVPDSCL